MKEAEDYPSLHTTQLQGWIVLVMFTAGAFMGWGFFMARSVFIGGFLTNTSFWILQRDLTRLLNGPLDGVKARFFIKYYMRLAVLALILFLVISKGLVNIAGLLVGLSTVFVSITILAVGIARKTINIREAS